MSVEKAEELQAQRSSKQPKMEGLALHSLLLDEPPALEVSNSGMGLNAIRTLMDLHNEFSGADGKQATIAWWMALWLHPEFHLGNSSRTVVSAAE